MRREEEEEEEEVSFLYGPDILSCCCCHFLPFYIKNYPSHLPFVPTPPRLDRILTPSIRIIGIICHLDIIHLDIDLCHRTAQHHLEHIGIAHRLERRHQRIPHMGRRTVAVRAHTARRGLVGILDLDRAFAQTVGIEFVVDRDGVVRAGAGAQRLLQGEGGDAVVRIGRQKQTGVEGVFAAGGPGAAGRDDAVGSSADGVGHDPGREATGFEATVLDNGIPARCRCGCG